MKRILGILAVLAVAISYGGSGHVAAASFTGQVKCSLDSTLTNALDLDVAVTSPLVSNFIQNYTNGTGANQANVVWFDERTLGSGASEDLDFAAGGLTDAFGVAVAPAKVRAVLIYSLSSNTVNLTLFGDAASIPFLNTAATTVTLQPGGMFIYTAPATAGVTVTAATGDIIQVLAGAASSTYRIIVIGTSA